ncbi:MAG: RNA polymerase sigma factor [Cyclobacteriaceae bacterium]
MTLEAFKNEVLPGKNKYFRFAYSITNHRELAEDVVQEVLLKMWDHRIDLVDVKNLEAWCMRMIRNLSIDKLRVKANQNESIEKASGHFHFDPSPLEYTISNEIQNMIGNLISELPAKQQEVVKLRDVMGYSYQEMAEILEMDINTVKVTLFRARKKLREQLIDLNIHGAERA